MIKKHLNLDFINTSEAYSKLIFLGNNNVVIPYINLNLLKNNDINQNNCFVDFSYCALINVATMEYESNNGKLNLNITEDQQQGIVDYFMIGNIDSINSEVKIQFREFHYYLNESSRFSNNQDDFIPYPTPNFNQTISAEKVLDFFLVEKLPAEVRAIVGKNVISLLWK
jgi:hypothetical protein